MSVFVFILEILFGRNIFQTKFYHRRHLRRKSVENPFMYDRKPELTLRINSREIDIIDICKLTRDILLW